MGQRLAVMATLGQLQGSESWHLVMQNWHLDVTWVRKLAFGDTWVTRLAVMATLGQLQGSESWHLVTQRSPFGSNGDLGPASRVRKFAFVDPKLAFGRHLGQKVGIW